MFDIALDSLFLPIGTFGRKHQQRHLVDKVIILLINTRNIMKSTDEQVDDRSLTEGRS